MALGVKDAGLPVVAGCSTTSAATTKRLLYERVAWIVAGFMIGAELLIHAWITLS